MQIANTIEASIKIIRENGRVKMSVLMPVWHKESVSGHLSVRIPLLKIDTVAKDESDIEIAVTEAITLFFMGAEKFGNGIEKELEELGWMREESEPVWDFDAQGNDVLQDLIQTGDAFVNPLIEFAA